MRKIRWASLAVGLALMAGCQSQPKVTEGEAGPAGSPGPPSSSVSESPPGESATPVSTGTSPATQPAADPTYKLGPTGIGPLKLGMTRAQAEATGIVNKFISPADTNSVCPWQSTVRHPSGIGSQVYISTKLGVAIIEAAGPLKTPDGIGIGSSRADVLRAYPGFRLIDGTVDNGKGFAKVPGNSNASYHFAFQNGTVYYLVLAISNQDCGNI
jgi:hypothetical protein